MQGTGVVEVEITGYCVVCMGSFGAEGDGSLADFLDRRVGECEAEFVLGVPDCGWCAVLEAHHVVFPGSGVSGEFENWIRAAYQSPRWLPT